MSVTMKGGTSGDSSNYLPNVSVAYDKQVPQDTSGGTCGTNLQLCQNTGNGSSPGDPGAVNPPVPECAHPDDSAV